MIETTAKWGPLIVKIRCGSEDEPVEVFVNEQWVDAMDFAPERVYDAFVEAIDDQVKLSWELFYADKAEARAQARREFA